MSGALLDIITPVINAMSSADDVHDLYKAYSHATSILQDSYYNLRHDLLANEGLVR